MGFKYLSSSQAEQGLPPIPQVMQLGITFNSQYLLGFSHVPLIL